MEERQCDMSLVRTPFRSTGLQLLQSHSATERRAGGISVGSRGVRQLASQKSTGSGLPGSDDATAVAPSHASPLHIASCHHGGRLLIWDCTSTALVASCDHGPNTAVAQCIATRDHLFVRLEAAPGTEGLEDDAHVHVWSAQTFKRLYVLRGHESRLTAMTVCEAAPHLLATASLDKTVRVWDLTKSTVSPVQTLSLDACGAASGLALLTPDVLLAAGSISPVTVWNWQTGDVLIAASADTTRATTVMRVVALDGATAAAGINNNNGNNSGLVACERRGSTTILQRAYAIFVGCTDGFVVERTLRLESTATAATTTWRATLTAAWQGKSHTATVGALHVDGNVLATCSMYDGAYVVNRTTGVARLLGPKTAVGTTTSIGCTSLAMDSANKRLLVGAHTGEVYVWNYAEFAAGAVKEVHLVASFTPHLSAVTGICLELSSGNVWERLLTCGGDGDICVLDYRCSARNAVTLPSTANCSVLARLPPLPGLAAHGALAFSPAANDAVTDVALAIVDDRTMCPVADGTRGLMLGKSLVAVAWSAPTSELLVATSDAVVVALAYERSSGWRRRRQWPLKQDYTVTCFADVIHGSDCVALGLLSKSGAGGAIATIALGKDPTSAAAVSYMATPGAVPQFLGMISAKGHTGPSTATIVAEMKSGVVQLFTWKMPTTNTPAAAVAALQAGTVLAPARVTASSALGRSRRARTVALMADAGSASGTATLWIPLEKSILRRRCSPNGAVEELPFHGVSSTFDVNVLSVTAVNQSEIGVVVLCEHTSNAYLCDATGAPTHIVAASGAVTPIADPSRKAKSGSRDGRGVCYPASASSLKPSLSSAGSSGRARLPYCLSVVFEKNRRYLAFAYENGLIQLVDTSYKYVFARLWGPDGPFSSTTATSSIAAVNDFVVAAAEQCALTAFPVPHRALMDASQEATTEEGRGH